MAAPEWNSYLSRVRNWFKSRTALLLPAACFLAGCAISYAITLRYQSPEGGWGSNGYSSNFYYQGQFDVPAIFEFSIGGTWSLLAYHLPEVVAIAALPAFALILVAAFRRRFQDNAIAVVFSLCIAISVGAAVLGIYPLGGNRQDFYTGPIVFLAAGVAFHWTAGCLAALTRRAWLAPALTVAAAGAITLAGVDNMWRDNPYRLNHNAKAAIAFLEEHVEVKGDVVYAGAKENVSMKFYQDEKPSNYHYGEIECWENFEPCLYEISRLIVSLPDILNRIFVIHQRYFILEMSEIMVELLGEKVSVEPVFGGGSFSGGGFGISLIANVKGSLAELAARSVYEARASGKPVIRSTFDVYLRENMLIYVKEPCGAEDVQETFFLHVDPVDASDLPKRRKQYGFDNLDFRFNAHGFRSAERCVALRSLPDYDFTAISTGQFLFNEDGSFTGIWGGQVRFDE